MYRNNAKKSQSHQKIRAVRKRIKASGTLEETRRAFRSERDCLELYRRLRHPNIIPLLGSFTLKGEYNLLFPWYPKTLDAFLEEDRVGLFKNDATFTSAVAGLASALQCVHEANWRSRLKPNFYTKHGYHHDFRPANILVTDSTFILADFGLSQFASKPPVTNWEENVGHYIAPECMDKSFTPLQVDYSYDIWAFGCFLSEIASYMALGRAGVAEFELRRKTKTYYNTKYTNSYFFDGESLSLKVEVTQWLQGLLDQTENRVVVSLISLSKKILQFSPQDRLNMAVHSLRLSFIHTKCLMLSAIDSIERTLSEVNKLQIADSLRTSEELRVEVSKLKAFGEYLHMDTDTEVDCELFKDAYFGNQVKEYLSRISGHHRFSEANLVVSVHEWASTESRPGVVLELKPSKLLDESVRSSIRKLCEVLPDQEFYWYLFRKRHFGDVPSEERLQILEDWGKEEPDLYADIGLQAKLQRLDQALLQRQNDVTGIDEEDLILDWSQLSGGLSTFSRYHNTGVYTCRGPGDARNKRKVLVEWVFISQFPQRESEDVRIDRLVRLARLLHLSKPPGFCTLDCLGFLPPKPDSPYKSGYGFVYPFPTLEGAMESMEPRSLRHLLDNSKFPITLGERFGIAKDLANSLFQLHSHNWLHKNLRSDNILFCGYESKRNEKQTVHYTITSGPYVIGFHHGRPEGDEFFSDNPSSEMDSEALLYRHPNYKPGESRFRRAFDCYGLAIVLIELALWSPAKDVKGKGKEVGPLIGKSLRHVFDKRYSRPLAQSMGNAYMEAARACLQEIDTAELEAASVPDTADVSDFYTDVTRKLNACYVG